VSACFCTVLSCVSVKALRWTDPPHILIILVPFRLGTSSDFCCGIFKNSPLQCDGDKFSGKSIYHNAFYIRQQGSSATGSSIGLFRAKYIQFKSCFLNNNFQCTCECNYTCYDETIHMSINSSGIISECHLMLEYYEPKLQYNFNKKLLFHSNVRYLNSLHNFRSLFQ